ncbi:MAG: Nif3-like dinuclear metal center hexameric protein [Cytophagales bacterium]|nr:Nif3-like dinuclear metal center hexameric protein [Cytophaga sp.]
MYRIADLISHLEQIAPLSYQEEYDNCGLLTGNKEDACTGVLLTLDVTEEVVDEAINKGFNLIVAHHPVIFKGLKKITGSNYVERIIIKAIQHNIALYAIHTNLDSVFHGVNGMLAARLHLYHTRILSPKKNLLSKLVTFIPSNDTESVMQSIFASGAGSIGNYSECSFTVSGTGQFKPDAGANPQIGKIGITEQVEEDRVEMIYPSYLEHKVVSALKKNHPYEEPAYDLISLENTHSEVGSGVIGELKTALTPEDFMKHVQHVLKPECIRYTTAFQGTIKKVAVCGGSGSFLLKTAVAAGADALITSDFKYHDFFDAENRILVCDIGHYESEIHTKELLMDILTKKFANIAIVLSSIHTNPIGYFKL